MSEYVDSYSLSQNSFCEFAMQFYRQSGHTFKSTAFSANNNIRNFIYSIYKPKHILAPNDWAYLNHIETISWLFSNGIRFFGSYEIGPQIDYFSVDLNVLDEDRSQVAYDVHRIVARLTYTPFSIVLFRSSDYCMLTWGYRMLGTISVYLSDWYSFEDMMANDILDQIKAAHLSSNSTAEFFFDFLYSFAREYYTHPESPEYIKYGLSSFSVNHLFDYELCNTEEQEPPLSAKDSYQFDYVNTEGEDEGEMWFNTDDDIDMLLLELDIDMKDFSDPDIDDIEIIYDDYDPLGDISKIDSTIFDDPIKMLKWLAMKTE